MRELIITIQKVLNDGADLVLGWTRSATAGVAVPARFRTPVEAEATVFDSTCVHNLAVHLPRLKGRTVGIVAKGCDVRSIVELITEREVERERVKVIAVPCPGVIDVKKVWRCFGFGNRCEDSGGQVAMAGKTVSREELLLAKCRGCRDIQPVIHDEALGDVKSYSAPSPAAQPTGLRQRFAAMAPAERREFWHEQFSRCIRCYACRDACPMCFCRDVCSIQTRDPHWAGGETNAGESQMIQQVRVTHLAGRCTGCEECERACPVGIPLMLLIEEQNRVVEEMFGYRAGTDSDATPPLLVFDIKKDSWEAR